MSILFKTAINSVCLAIVILAIICICFCNKKNTPLSPTSPVPGNGITVLTPNGNEIYHVGDTMDITWLLEDTSVVGLQIDFSPDGGANYFNFGLLQSAFPEFQSRKVPWVIPDSIGLGSGIKSTCTNSCRIFVHDYFDYSISDVSDKYFSIRPK
jgi:hypothetical protein